MAWGAAALQGPLEKAAHWPVIGPLLSGPAWAVGLRLGGIVVGLWLFVVLLRRLGRGGGGHDERELARKARRLVEGGRYEEAGDFHVVHGNLEAAVHMFERAAAWGKAARVSRLLGQEARAKRFDDRAAAGAEPGAPSSASAARRGLAEAEGAAPTRRLDAEARRAVAAGAAPAPDERRPAPGTRLWDGEADPRKALATRIISRPAVVAREALDHATRVAGLPDGGERYEILSELGRGGMAVVYRARDRLLGRTVALKFLGLGAGDPTGLIELFLREARAAAALNHPGIVTVYDLGVMGQRPFISMELIEGEDVLHLLERAGPLGVGEAVWVVIQAAAALGFAHQRGLVHRDVKPANLMISTDGTLKVADFGLAQLIRRQHHSLTVSGTPAYMSPEQLAGRALDARTDVFSLAVTLYEMLTAKLPFEEFDRDTVPPAPSRLRPEVPSELDAAILGAFAVDPTCRPESVAAFAQRVRTAYDAYRVPAPDRPGG